MHLCAGWTSPACSRSLAPHRAQAARSGYVPARRRCTRQWTRVAAQLQQGGGGGASAIASSAKQLEVLACTGALAAVLCGAVGGAAGFMYSSTTARLELLTSEVRELRREVQLLIAEDDEAFKKVTKSLEPLDVVKNAVETVQSIAEATT